MWLNSPIRHWTQSIIYQKTLNLALYHWHNLWALPMSGVKSSSRCRVVLAVCGRPAESGSKRVNHKEHANVATRSQKAPRNFRNRSF
jgi:hypothetical protein